MFNSLRFESVLFGCICLSSASAFSQEHPADPPQTQLKEASQKRTRQERAGDLAVLTNAAAKYALKIENGPAVSLRREPVYRWSNSIAAAIGREVKDAAVYVWLADGRPAAIGSVVWYTQIGLFHEFQSLAPGPLTAERDRKTIWEAGQSGIEFRPVPDSPRPADAAGAAIGANAIDRRSLPRGSD